MAEVQANYDAAVAGPTREERAIADAQVQAAAAAVTVLERRLDKMVLRAPADGVVSVIVAEVGENVRAGRVSRVSPSDTAVRNCTRDEGGPFEVGNQVLISSHRKLLLSKAMVVSVAETAGQDPVRQG